MGDPIRFVRASFEQPSMLLDAHPVNLDFREDESSDDLHHEFKVNAEILTELAERTEDLSDYLCLC